MVAPLVSRHGPCHPARPSPYARDVARARAQAERLAAQIEGGEVARALPKVARDVDRHRTALCQPPSLGHDLASRGLRSGGEDDLILDPDALDWGTITITRVPPSTSADRVSSG